MKVDDRHEGSLEVTLLIRGIPLDMEYMEVAAEVYRAALQSLGQRCAVMGFAWDIKPTD